MAKWLRVIQLSDLHIDDPECERMGVDSRLRTLMLIDRLKTFLDCGADRVIISLTGDLAEGNGVEWLYDHLEHIGISNERIITVMGNHDDAAAYSSRLDRTGYFGISIEGFDFICLDSSTGVLGDDQTAWLAKELAQNEGRLFILMHHPVLDCGDTLMDRKYPLGDRDRVKEILIDSGREVVILCGHYHSAQKHSEANITQYVAPAGHVQIRRIADDFEVESYQSGFRIVDIRSEGVSTFNVMLDQEK